MKEQKINDRSVFLIIVIKSHWRKCSS